MHERQRNRLSAKREMAGICCGSRQEESRRLIRPAAFFGRPRGASYFNVPCVRFNKRFKRLSTGLPEGNVVLAGEQQLQAQGWKGTPWQDQT